MAVYALRIGEEEQAAGNIHKAREAAKMVIKLSSKAGALPFGEKNKAFLMSKATRVLGDLDYLGNQYEKAFQEYLNSCELLAISILQGGSGSVFLQRRYEGAIDRLQEQLHALPDQHDQLIFTRQILAKIKKEPEKTRKSLEKLKTYMETTMQAIKYIG